MVVIDCITIGMILSVKFFLFIVTEQLFFGTRRVDQLGLERLLLAATHWLLGHLEAMRRGEGLLLWRLREQSGSGRDGRSRNCSRFGKVRKVGQTRVRRPMRVRMRI